MLPQSQKPVIKERLINPDDNFRRTFPHLSFSDEYSFLVSDAPILVTDPTYLADVYNSNDEIATFLREKGIFVMNFGGDVSSPVLYQDPYFLLPISLHISENDPYLSQDFRILADEVGTDSGSFIFLPLGESIPPTLKETISIVLAKRNGALLTLPSGKWTIYYEQWDTPQGSHPTLYRNIVGRYEGEV